MNWEETIKYIRGVPEFKELVEKAYLEEDLQLNVRRFRQSEEFKETLQIFEKSGFGKSVNILDIGAGNGVASVCFAMEGFNVTAVEPDSSNTVGNGAIKILKDKYKLENINVISSSGESIPLENEAYDIVYVRQAMHHANHLNDFLKEISRLLKKAGMLVAVREHVIFNEKDKQYFLKEHPLQKFYGGENAYTLIEYKQAIVNAGLTLIKTLKYFDSVINYFPLTMDEVLDMKAKRASIVNCGMKKHHLASFQFTNPLIAYLYRIKLGKVYNERIVPGRMYSFIAIKK